MQHLTLRRADLEAMVDHVRAGWPEEACGLLGGPPGRVEKVYPAENALHSRVEYTLDPAEQIRVMLEIEAAGWELTGIFHSHPAGPPAPSATDVARAYYPEAVYIILAPGRNGPAGEWLARAFTLAEGDVVPVELVLES